MLVGALSLLALVVVLTQRMFGTNWAAGIGTVLAVGAWLWSARRDYREEGPHLESRLIVDRVGDQADEEQPRTSIRRIRVANAGTRPLRQVQVTLIGCVPTPLWFQPVRLQRMHGGPHPFDLPPRSEVYIDLVALPHGHPEFILVHDNAAHGGVPSSVPIQPLELSVEVSAESGSRASFQCQVARGSTGKLEVMSSRAGQSKVG